LFWRFALLSVPSAYLGGYLRVPSQLFRLLLGVILLFSAAWLLWRHREPAKVTLPKAPIALIAGAVIGLFAGLTGTGGGYFLTPLLLFCEMGTNTKRGGCERLLYTRQFDCRFVRLLI